MSAEHDLRLKPTETYFWRKILFSNKAFRQEDLHTLVELESVGTAFFELRAYIGRYRPESWTKEGSSSDNEDDTELGGGRKKRKDKSYRRVSKEAKEELDMLLDKLAPYQRRKLELAWLRLIRGDGKLGIITNTGGGGLKKNYMSKNILLGMPQTQPPESNFFLELLGDCAQRGFHFAVVWGNETHKTNLRRVIDSISEAVVNPSLSNLPLVFAYATSVVVPFFGSEFYNYLVYFTYKNKIISQPTPLHTAIVSLARPITFQGQRKPGLSAILNASIDDTLGEALDGAGIERRTITVLSKVRIQKDSNTAASGSNADSSNSTQQVVYQMNGWLPRKFHEPKIETLTCNMLQRAGGADLGCANDTPRFSSAVAQIYEDYFPGLSFVREAVGCATLETGSHMLMVGIEIEEVAALDRLRQDADSGAQFSALIRWPKKIIGHAYTQATKESIRAACNMLPSSQIDAIWFDDPEELPRLLCKIVKD